MFGSSGSPPKDDGTSIETASPEKQKPPGIEIPSNADGPTDANSMSVSPSGRQSGDDFGPNADKEKKRRSSSVAKAKDMLSSAKNSFHFAANPNDRSHSSLKQSPIQKLGKIDPALSVPQGSLNNSAGESSPGPRSTFRVGVTEDKNKKCRRTMEDTHAYLYNFLSTPAPALNADKSRKTDSSGNPMPDRESLSKSVVETDNGYFAIFDGHAGTFAADWCGKKLHLLLEDTIRKNPNTPIPELLDQTFTNVDQQLEKLPLKNSGCTAVIAVLRWEDRIPNSYSATGSTSIAPAAAAAAKAASDSSPPAKRVDSPVQTHSPQSNSDAAQLDEVEASLRPSASRQRVLYTANVGDARIVLCRNGKALRLSYDHKGSDENEGKRVANAGGLILNNRVNGVLAVTRALGDAYMKELVTGHPYTTETVIQPDIDEFLILACDGLWDVCSDQEAVDLIRRTEDPQVASKQLVDHALSRFSTDNLSCMVVRFNSSAVRDTVERRAESIGVEGDPATARGGISEAEAIVGKQRKHLDDSGEKLERVNTDMILEDVQGEEEEPGPELDLTAIEAARAKAAAGQSQAAKMS